MKTFSNGILLGLFGAVAVSISFAAQWPTWVMFVAWVSFYVFGKTIIGSLKAFLQIALGTAMGLSIQFTGTFLSGYLGGGGLPVAVFLFVGSLAYISKIKLVSNIPAWFFGLIIFFGVHPKPEIVPLALLVIPIAAGFLFAFLNDKAMARVAVHPKTGLTIPE